MRRVTRQLFPPACSPVLTLVLCVSLFYAPLLALPPQRSRAAVAPQSPLHPRNFSPPNS